MWNYPTAIHRYSTYKCVANVEIYLILYKYQRSFSGVSIFCVFDFGYPANQKQTVGLAGGRYCLRILKI